MRTWIFVILLLWTLHSEWHMCGLYGLRSRPGSAVWLYRNIKQNLWLQKVHLMQKAMACFNSCNLSSCVKVFGSVTSIFSPSHNSMVWPDGLVWFLGASSLWFSFHVAKVIFVGWDLFSISYLNGDTKRTPGTTFSSPQNFRHCQRLTSTIFARNWHDRSFSVHPLLFENPLGSTMHFFYAKRKRWLLKITKLLWRFYSYIQISSTATRRLSAVR